MDEKFSNQEKVELMNDEYVDIFSQLSSIL
jgi:hypothetical protein